MKQKFPNLKWVIVMRHAKYGQGDMPTPESKAFIKGPLSLAMRERLSTNGEGKSIVITSLEFRGVVTGNYFSRYMGMVNTIGIRQLGGDRYGDGKRMAELISECLPQHVEVAIIVGHFEAVPGMANAIVSSFGQTVECFEPKYLDGVVINMETGEHHVGINKFFGVEAEAN